MRKASQVTRFKVASKYKKLVMSTRYKRSPYTARVLLHSRTSLRAATLKEVERSISREVHNICSRKHGSSVLRSSTNAAITHFNWSHVIREVKAQAPTLHSLIKSAISRRGKRLHESAIGMTSAVLLKHRSRCLCLPQAVISVVLYAGHCSKQVNIIPMHRSYYY